MKKMTKNLIFIITIFCNLKAFAGENKKIISIGGAITEIIYQLKAENLLIANDTTSYFPKEAQKLTKVGYQRALSVEGILSLNPDLIIMTDEAGPKIVIKQLQDAGVKILQLKSPKNIEDILVNILSIGKEVSKEKEAQKLVLKIKEQQKLLAKNQQNKRPKVLIIHHHLKGSPTAAGKNTAADAIIKISGGDNIFFDFENYKVISSETIIAKNPDIIIIATPMADEIKDKNSLKNHDSFKQSSAFKNNNIYVFDALEILGFGPRTIDSALKLNKLYQDL